MSPTELAERPLIELHMEADEDGEVTPVLPVTWSFTNDLVDLLERNNFRNPYLVIAVGYEEPYGFDMDRIHFKATKIYVKKLLEASPKEYLEFSHPGKNIVMAYVLEVHDKDDEDMVWEWAANPSRMSTSLDEEKNSYELEVYSYDEDSMDAYNIASFRQDVIVPEEMFAREPAKWRKRLVGQFYGRSKAFDQCDFRAQFLMSLGLSIPTQLYGIFARFFSLVVALVVGSRGMSFRALFALNPHDFAHRLYYSFWYYDRDGRKRKGLLRWINPPQIILYVGIALISLLPGIVIMFFSHLTNKGIRPYTFGDVLVTSAIADVVILAFVGLCFLAFTRKGQYFTTELYWRFKKAPKQPEPLGTPDTFGLLRQQVQSNAGVMPSQVKNETFVLKFKQVKSYVCRPFAQKS